MAQMEGSYRRKNQKEKVTKKGEVPTKLNLTTFVRKKKWTIHHWIDKSSRATTRIRS